MDSPTVGGSVLCLVLSLPYLLDSGLSAGVRNFCQSRPPLQLLIGKILPILRQNSKNHSFFSLAARFAPGVFW